MEKQMLTVSEVAVYFGVSQKTVRRMIDDNEIAFLRLRGHLRIPLKNLEGWVDKKTINKKTATA
jgi:excisionase family DNA binding protein